MRYWLISCLFGMVALNSCMKKEEGGSGREEFIEKSSFSSHPLVEEYGQILSFERTLRIEIDGRSGRQTSQWGSITALEPGPTGSLLIVDKSNQVGHLISKDGQVLATYGNGRGAGPGEFLDLVRMIWGGSDTILALDWNLTRLTVFDLCGVYIRSVQVGFRANHMGGADTTSVWIRPYLDSTHDRIVRVNTLSGIVLAELGGKYIDAIWHGKTRSDVRLSSTSDGFLMSFDYPYEILELTRNGEIRHKFGRFVDWLVPPTPSEYENFGIWYPTGGNIQRAYRFPDGKTLVLLVRTISTGSWQGLPRFTATWYFDIYSSDYSWITTIPGSEFLQGTSFGGIVVANDGGVWIRSEGEHQILSRFEFTFR